MSDYTLNDIEFNPVPITICPVGQKDDADAEELKTAFQKNKELMEYLKRQFNKRKISERKMV